MLITNQTTQDYWFGPLHLPAGVGQTLTVDDTSATSLYLTDDSVADLINTLAASTPTRITVSGAAPPFPRATGVPAILHGDGSPEGVVYAGQGSVYLRRDNSGGTQMYQKSTGIHVNTGWIGLAGAAITTPTGAMHAYGGTTAPTGWLLCDGAAVSRTTYADLFLAIGTNFGNGDGSTTFNVPDMRGRTPVGFAASGGNTDVATIGNSDTVAAANRRPKHRHTPHTHGISGAPGISDPTHSHTFDISNGGSNFSLGHNAPTPARTTSDYSSGGQTGPTFAVATGITATAGTLANASMDGGSSTASDSLDAPAYLVVNQIIKT